MIATVECLLDQIGRRRDYCCSDSSPQTGKPLVDGSALVKENLHFKAPANYRTRMAVSGDTWLPLPLVTSTLLNPKYKYS